MGKKINTEIEQEESSSEEGEIEDDDVTVKMENPEETKINIEIEQEESSSEEGEIEDDDIEMGDPEETKINSKREEEESSSEDGEIEENDDEKEMNDVEDYSDKKTIKIESEAEEKDVDILTDD